MLVLLVLVGLGVLAMIALNWVFFWRRNQTDTNRGVETWQGWDDGHGAGL